MTIRNLKAFPDDMADEENPDTSDGNIDELDPESFDDEPEEEEDSE